MNEDLQAGGEQWARGVAPMPARQMPESVAARPRPANWVANLLPGAVAAGVVAATYWTVAMVGLHLTLVSSPSPAPSEMESLREAALALIGFAWPFVVGIAAGLRLGGVGLMGAVAGQIGGVLLAEIIASPLARAIDPVSYAMVHSSSSYSVATGLADVALVVLGGVVAPALILAGAFFGWVIGLLVGRRDRAHPGR